MSLVENFLSYALRSAVIPVINGKDCRQFGAQLVGKQDWNPKRQCPALKIVLYGKFSVHWGTSGQVYSVLDFSPGPSVTWIRGWDRASLGSLLNTGLGFPFPWMQRGSRTETSLCLVLTQSQAMTREWPRLGKRRSTLASWGLGCHLWLYHLPLPLCFTCCHRQDKVENQPTQWEAEREWWWRKRWRWKKAGWKLQKVPVSLTEVGRLLRKWDEGKENESEGCKSQVFGRANRNKAGAWFRKVEIDENKRDQ